ncbi:stage II sporulation protein R [Desulfotomaculum copahuensis]|uniref:Stage II sporulation protein R n=1 Tax=Desulfotomaculum copahuensis TaxID=1838280 RepID=A0A1B7LET4_9FIRM|nr:stage II sporulation protein R [Desulfotomaculum copahuensis]OAT81793.1 stage II sporulation protein R [Desulfotomaculum copahuensis]
MNRKMRISLVALGLLAAGLAGGWQWHRVQQARMYAPDQLIRFHVIANSDSAADQALKLHVRDVIVGTMAPRFRQAKNITQAREIARANLGYMQQLAVREIHREGKDYPVSVCMGHFPFPVKTYHLATAGNPWEKDYLTLPAGEYEAVRVVIGRGAGHNWWCVLFPPLCFVDVPASWTAPPENGAVRTDGEKPPVAGNNGQRSGASRPEERGPTAGPDGMNAPAAGPGSCPVHSNGPAGRPAEPAFRLQLPPAVMARAAAAPAGPGPDGTVEYRLRVLDWWHSSVNWFDRLWG